MATRKSKKITGAFAEDLKRWKKSPTWKTSVKAYQKKRKRYNDVMSLLKDMCGDDKKFIKSVEKKIREKLNATSSLELGIKHFKEGKIKPLERRFYRG